MDRLRRLLWIPVLVVGIVTYQVVLAVMIDTKNVNFFPSLLLIGAITVPVTVLVFAESGGRVTSVTPWVVATTAITGGVVGTVTAGVLEYDTLRDLGTVPMVFVGLIEEGAKLIVPLVVYLLVRPKDPRGGVIIGIASGMGFATLETMGYGFQSLLSAGNLDAVDDTLLLRALLAPACHIAWTGMTTAMLWRIHSARHKGRAVAAFAGTYLVAVALHATWDGSTSVAVHATVAIIGLVVLLVFLHRAHPPGRDAEAGPGHRLSRWEPGRTPSSSAGAGLAQPLPAAGRAGVRRSPTCSPGSTRGSSPTAASSSTRPTTPSPASQA